MRTIRNSAGWLVAAVFALGVAGPGSADAHLCRNSDAGACIASRCDAGDTSCERKCCEDACDAVQGNCHKDAGDLRKTTRRGCKSQRDDLRAACEDIARTDKIACRSLCGLNDPNNDPEQCEQDAKQARRNCKEMAKAARDSCDDTADAGRELARDQCEADVDICEAACNP